MSFLNKKEIFLFFILGSFFLKFTIENHSTHKKFNYRSEIWADKASYYVYLPSLVYYDFKASNFPDSIDLKTGNGFNLNMKTNKVETKVTYGVALLQAPFFVLAHTFSGFINQPTDGFSLIYHRAIDFAAIFYLMVGLIFLYKLLSFYTKRILGITIILIISLGTHLYHYSIDESGMSHVYSFCLISVFLYWIKKTNFLLNFKKVDLIIVSIIFFLIILIRPTNVVFGLFYFFFDNESINTLKQRVKRVFKPTVLLIILASAILVFIPQFVYWNYLFGSFIYYSYENESFYFLQPKFIEYLFSARSGLLIYTPLFIMPFIAILYKRYRKNSIFIALNIILMSYIYSCWWDWKFGCSFGARNFVEYTPYLALSLTFVFDYLNKKKCYIFRLSLSIFIVSILLYNIKLSSNFDKCFFGKSNWDYEEIKTLVLKPNINN